MSLATPHQGGPLDGPNGHPMPHFQQSLLIDHLRALTQVVTQQGKTLTSLYQEIAQPSAAMKDMQTTLRALYQRQECM